MAIAAKMFLSIYIVMDCIGLLYVPAWWQRACERVVVSCQCARARLHGHAAVFLGWQILTLVSELG